MDMLVNLNTLPAKRKVSDLSIVRVQPPDRLRMLSFVENHFSQGWTSECGLALSFLPCRCFAAVRDGEPVGFCCYNTTAKGFFGPIGVIEEERKSGIGSALLITALEAMREEGYGYAVIGWCDEAEAFYRKAVDAIPIPDSSPRRSVYRELLIYQKQE